MPSDTDPLLLVITSLMTTGNTWPAESSPSFRVSIYRIKPATSRAHRVIVAKNCRLLIVSLFYHSYPHITNPI